MNEKKQCKICLEWKKISEFYTRKCFSKKKGDYIYYHPECKECTKQRTINWGTNNRDRFLELRKRVNKNAPSSQDRSQKLNQKRQEEGYWEEYWKKNPDKRKKYDYDRMNKNHNISEVQWDNCKRYFDYKCAYCNLLIDEHYVTYGGEIRWSDFHKEHVDHNGTNDLSNCIPSCRDCNVRKWQFEFEDWYPNQVFYSPLNHQKINKWLSDDNKKY